MDSNSSEKKNEKISKSQKQKLVDYMTSHLEFARGQFSGPNSNISCKDEWESLSNTLNSMGGSGKTVEQWKKCWQDLKRAVKKQVNLRRSFMNKTGGGGYGDIPRDLNALEEQILQVITIDAVDGDSCTPESGVMQEEYLDESMLSVEILEDEIYEPPLKGKKPLPATSTVATASKYNEALVESRKMHTALMSKLQKIEKQNEEILKILNVPKQVPNDEDWLQ